MVIAAAALAGFFIVQRREGGRLVGALLRRAAGGREWLGVAAIERLYERLGAIYANRRGVAASAAIHMAVWFFGAVEVWVALYAMGHPVSISEAIVIESLGQAVRGAAFAVPGALGVQEGGFIALCALFGVPAGPALALSLVKRVPDLVLGLPGLLAWQSLEGRRVFGRGERLAGGSAEPCTSGR
jgi:putative membrane protein